MPDASVYDGGMPALLVRDACEMKCFCVRFGMTLLGLVLAGCRPADRLIGLGTLTSTRDVTESDDAPHVSTNIAKSAFPVVEDTEKDQTGPLPAAVAAEKFRVPPGFSVEVFASEPLVRNPIAADFDDRGRLWVAENFSYAERPVNWRTDYHDDVIILSDDDGDGTAETRKVFTSVDGPLMGLVLGRGGVFLITPPRLVFIPDADGDDRPDGEPITLLTALPFRRKAITPWRTD